MSFVQVNTCRHYGGKYDDLSATPCQKAYPNLRKVAALEIGHSEVGLGKIPLAKYLTARHLKYPLNPALSSTL